MPPAAKKYKLFSAAAATEGGAEPLCAFFASEAGCRSGDKCKFKHALPEEVPTVDASSSSVVSSESEDEEGPKKDLFASPGEMTSSKKKEAQENKNDKKKKNKKKRKSSDGMNDKDIFAKPKKNVKATAAPSQPTNKKQKTSQEKRPGKVSPPPEDSAPPATTKSTKNRSPPKPKTQGSVPDFRSLNLPIASFSIPSDKGDKKQATPRRSDSALEADASDVSVTAQSTLPLPNSTPVGLKWQKAILQTRAHMRYDGSFDFSKIKEMDQAAGRGNASEWIKTRPFGDWCKDYLQSIAIDCEMCETKDPVSGVRNPKALCRISVINGEKPDEVLLDTLVKPAWPVTDYRTWVNGIQEEHLENVQFTLRHAQAFLMALCSEETVILGHALHNDLVALKMEHHCNVDSACLFPVKDSPDSSPSLKDLSMTVLKTEMPNKHDSVNDARTALLCLEAYMKADGKVEPVVRTPRSNRIYASQLFVHRIPKVCQTSHLSSMFLSHASVEPSEVGDIEFTGDSGKTLVTFPSPRHANLAFDTLEGDEQPDKSGRMQKKVFLRNGDYVRVRKMAFTSNRNSTPKKKE